MVHTLREPHPSTRQQQCKQTACYCMRSFAGDFIKSHVEYEQWGMAARHIYQTEERDLIIK